MATRFRTGRAAAPKPGGGAEFERAAGKGIHRIEVIEPPAAQATVSERMLWAINFYISTVFSEDGRFVGRLRDIGRIRGDVIDEAVRLLSGKLKGYEAFALRNLNMADMADVARLGLEIRRLSAAIDVAAELESQGRAQILINGTSMMVDEHDCIGLTDGLGRKINVVVKGISRSTITFTIREGGEDVAFCSIPVGRDDFLGDAHIAVLSIRDERQG